MSAIASLSTDPGGEYDTAHRYTLNLTTADAL